jgi:hypothetical protein
MKRRTFIKRSSIGLSALAAGAAGAGGLLGDDGKRRVYGIPDSVRARPPLEHNLLRLSLARTDVPPDAWQEVAALSLLAQDVFDQPEVARAFTRDPEAYLKTIGLEDVRLDPRAVEVKVALALGDPGVHEALERDDPRAFLEALEGRGLLRSPAPSVLAQRIGSHIAGVKARLGDTVSPEACTAFAICLAVAWVWAAIVQDAVVAVAVAAAVSLYVYAVVYTETVGPRPQKMSAIDAAALEGEPPFRLASALGGPEFGNRVAGAFIDDSVERVAAAVESLEAYREAGVMKGEQLRALVRTQMLRTLQGHTVDIGNPRP